MRQTLCCRHYSIIKIKKLQWQWRKTIKFYIISLLHYCYKTLFLLLHFIRRLLLYLRSILGLWQALQMVNHVFTLVLEKNKKYSTGWVVELNFLITLHQKDQTLLESIQSFFEVGIISKQGENVIKFQVRSNKDLAVIIDHFDKYPLITQKLADYLLFKQAFPPRNS